MRFALALMLLVAPSYAFATDVNCSSSATVQSAIDAASSGDTLTCTAGGTWATDVSVPSTKGLTLDGGGYTITRGTSTNTVMLTVTLHATTMSEVKNFTFVDPINVGSRWSSALLKMVGSPTTEPFRVHNNTFTTTVCLNNKMMWVSGGAYGLFDNNTFNSGDTETMHYWGAYDDGWTDDVTPGSADALYVENNTWNNICSDGYAGSSAAMQNYYGSKTVFRYNTIYYMQLDVHGNTLPKGRWYEVYENDWYGQATTPPGNLANIMTLRGGSGVVFNNRVYKNGASVVGGVKLREENATSYPGPYQIGRGKLTGANTDGNNFALDPVYFWNNTYPDLGTQVNVGVEAAASTYIQLNRDFYTSSSTTTQRPGYTPYQYPHPLAGGADAIPSAFSFADVTGAAVSTVTTSNPCVTVAGIDAGQTPAVSITGTGCTYNVDGGSFVSTSGTVGLDNVVCLRGTSSASYLTVLPSCTLTIGGVTDSGAPWTVTTQAAVEDIVPPNPPRMRAVTMRGTWR